jgi:hypothetical protein
MPATSNAALRRAAHACAAAAALATTAIAATPRDAEAQLLRRMKQAAQEHIANKAVDAGASRIAGEETAPPGAPAAAPAATRNGGSSRLEITPERIDAFVVAMRPMVAAVERRRAESARQAAYTKRKDAWTACTDSNRARVQYAPPATAGIEENGKWMDRSADYQVRSAKAGVAGDEAAAAALQDSMIAATYKGMTALYPAMGACGDYVYAPAPVPAAQSRADSSAVPTATGMTPTQFGLLRERIAAFIITDGADDGFSPAEREALTAKKSALAPLGPLFRDGSLAWTHWSDLPGKW